MTFIPEYESAENFEEERELQNMRMKPPVPQQLTTASPIADDLKELEFNLERAEYIVTRLVKDDEVFALDVPCYTEEWPDLVNLLVAIKMDSKFYATYPHEGRSMLLREPLARVDSDKD